MATRLWLAGFGNLLVYIPLFLLLRGNIALGNDGLEWYLTPLPPDPANAEGNDGEGAARDQATKMLYYPIAYTIVVSPLSIVRWITFNNEDLTAVQKPENRAIATAILLFHSVFRLSGFVNVCLLATRPGVLLFEEKHDGGVGENEVARPGGQGGDIPLRRRYNAADAGRQDSGTGFGGPMVNLGRHEDDERVLGRR